MKKVLSLLFPLSLLLIIIILEVIKFSSFSIFHNSIIYSYVLWIFYELCISRRDFKEKNKTNTDGITREVYAIAHGLTIISAIYFSNKLENNILLTIGVLIYALGLFLRIWSSLTLGRFYSHNARVINNHKIIDIGPYKQLRHPAYSGMIIIHIGILFLFFNFISLFILCCLLIPTIIYRITIEEKLLFNVSDYKRKFINKKRLLPFIW